MTIPEPTPPDTIHLSAAEAQALAARALAGIGLGPAEVEATAAHLLDAELCGYRHAGLARIPALAAAPELREPRRPPRIERETPVSALLDGGGGLGYVALPQAADVAIGKAAAAGLAAVAVHSAWNSGRAGYYVERIARAGLVAIHTTSTPPLVVPPAGTERALGTNPVAIGIPGRPDPLVVDLGTGAASWAEVASLAERDGAFPDPVGIGPDGEPSGRARDILAGGLWPFGGGKGFALSLAVQALGLAAGARRWRGRPADFGYLLLAVRPDLFGEPVELERDLAAFLDGLRAASGTRIPSERAFRQRTLRRRDGLAIPRALHERLTALAQQGRAGPL